jgi:hypothetical protein
VEEIDAAILSFARPRWLKVARVIGDVWAKWGLGADEHVIGDRIQALVADGRLEAQGDLSKWRFSEVRLPQVTTDAVTVH